MNVHKLRTRESEFAERLRPPPTLESAPPARGWRLAARMIRVRKWTIVWTIVCAMMIATGVLMLQAPVYTASTTVLVELPQGRLEAKSASDAALVAHKIQVLSSDALAQKVIKHLSLERDFEFNGGKPNTGLLSMILTTIGLRERPVHVVPSVVVVDPVILKRFAARLSVTAQGRSSALLVSFSSSDPRKAAQIVNAIADELIAEDGGVTTASQSGGNQLAQLEERARRTAADVEQYKASHSSALTLASTAVPVQDNSAELNSARTSATAFEAKFRQLNTLFHSGAEVEKIAQVANSAALNQLVKQKAELDRKHTELAATYGERHPQMIALQSERSDLDTKIQSEIRHVIQNAGGQLNAARARVTSLETLKPAQAAANVQSDEQLRRLEQAAADARSAYQEALVNGPATEASLTRPSGVRQIERASTPRAPSSPNRPLGFGISFAASTLIAFVLALFIESSTKGFRTAAELEHFLRTPNLSVVPRVPRADETAERVVQKPRSAFAEAVRSLFSGVQVPPHMGPSKVILITSSVPGEGKTSLAISLGRVAARAGARVILIDGDMRHPSVGRELGDRRAQVGLVDALTGRCDLATILKRDPLSPLEFLPVAAPSANAAEIITSPALRNLIEVLRQHYDLVILDAAPMLPVADTRLLSKLADRVVYVVECNKTPREAVASGLAMLRNVGATIAGCVLNKTDMHRYAVYGYGLSSYRHDGYSGRYYSE